MVFDYEADCSCNARMLLQPNCKEPVSSELRREAPEVREKNGIEPRRRDPGAFVRICPCCLDSAMSSGSKPMQLHLKLHVKPEGIMRSLSS